MVERCLILNIILIIEQEVQNVQFFLDYVDAYIYLRVGEVHEIDFIEYVSYLAWRVLEQEGDDGLELDVARNGSVNNLHFEVIPFTRHEMLGGGVDHDLFGLEDRMNGLLQDEFPEAVFV